MIEYQCCKCGMGVTGLTCSKCGAALRHNKIKKNDGSEVQVSECPNGCGKIKSPMCCGHDMEVASA